MLYGNRSYFTFAPTNISKCTAKFLMATPMRNARQKAYKNEAGNRRDDQELLVSSGRKKDKDKIASK